MESDNFIPVPIMEVSARECSRDHSQAKVSSNISGSGAVGFLTRRKLASVRGMTFIGRVPSVRRRTSCMWLSPMTMIASSPAASRISL